MFFDHVTRDPVDPIFGLQKLFKEDPRKEKINLSIGVYKHADLSSSLFSSVQKAEQSLAKESAVREYLPIEGDEAMIALVKDLIFGSDSQKILGVQTVGGTSALRIGADFLCGEVSESIAISDPTWGNHHLIFERCGMKVERYPYYDEKRKALAFDQMLDFLSKMKEKSSVLLQASCHNPTGLDLNDEQWSALSELMHKKKLLPFFDLAYHGLGDGLVEDVRAIRNFVKKGHECLVAYTCSKSFGIYAERAGALFVAADHEKAAGLVKNKFKKLIRTMYSNPPYHGGMLIRRILETPVLKKEWEEELAQMRTRLNHMRGALCRELSHHGDCFLPAKGFFIFTGLKKREVDRLVSEYGIYLTDDGRMNIAGLSDHNVSFIAKALLKVMGK